MMMVVPADTAASQHGDDRAMATVSRRELLIDGSDATFRALVHNLLALSARLETIRSGFAANIGLSGVQYTALITISHLQGRDGVGIKEIAEHLSLSGAFVTIETGKLIARGFVRKRINPNDRRRVQLLVTANGRELLDRLAPVQRQVNDMLFGRLTNADFKTMVRLSRDLVESARTAVALGDYLARSEKVRPR